MMAGINETYSITEKRIKVKKRERLGGLLNFYYREAAK
jgi:hypothetical protein